ncbi:MAG: cysteine--tRNA ligase [Chitinophagaceae bacterium]|nr:MAG: cysteine--tRNA ligase [Chitinophagaceae bacterium]
MEIKKHQLKIYNSLSKQKEEFKPINNPFVGMYVCGPTVYNDVHLGNVRTFISFDIVYRYLLYLGYKVRYVRNLTDVGHLENDADQGEDKIAQRAKLENLEPMEIVQKYTNGFHDVMRTFNTLSPNIEPSATGHIIEQIEYVKTLINKGLAYEVNGSVYFNVRKYNEIESYGILSGRKLEDLKAGSRELDSQSEKKNPEDFALWKKAGPSHIMRWPSPWGEGFPGWHLECTVMSTKYLGTQFDIHGGGMDLKFPHHECEIAQGHGGTGVSPAKYWMHSNMLTVNGTKMSKSLGNAFLPDELITGNHELLERGYPPMVIKFFMLQSHYSSTLDFSNDALDAAEKGFNKLMSALDFLENTAPDRFGEKGTRDKEFSDSLDTAFEYMDDDFNTAKTLAELFDISSKIHALKNNQLPDEVISKAVFSKIKTTFHALLVDIMGLKKGKSSIDTEIVDGLMLLISEIRTQARKDKNYELSDKIRDKLSSLKIQMKDEKDGKVSWKLP